MYQSLAIYLLVLGLFFALLVVAQIGRMIGQRRLAAEPEASHPGFGVIAGAVFGLMGLLIAFTFSAAASRFDARRQLIVHEVNAIGTAYLRLNLLPPELQTELRSDFRNYVEARLAVYRTLPDVKAAKRELARSKVLQNEIWNRAVAAGKGADGVQASLLLLPAVNEMIDVTTTRTLALQTHTPSLILGLLAVVALACALLVGHAMAVGKIRSWIHVLIFALVLASTIYVIADLEYPRAGLIRIQAVDRLMADLLEGMK